MEAARIIHYKWEGGGDAQAPSRAEITALVESIQEPFRALEIIQPLKNGKAILLPKSKIAPWTAEWVADIVASVASVLLFSALGHPFGKTTKLGWYLFPLWLSIHPCIFWWMNNQII